MREAFSLSRPLCEGACELLEILIRLQGVCRAFYNVAPASVVAAFLFLGVLAEIQCCDSVSHGQLK